MCGVVGEHLIGDRKIVSEGVVIASLVASEQSTKIQALAG